MTLHRSDPSTITALLHTRNRPEFVLRCLDYYDTWYRGNLVVLDASDDAVFNSYEKKLSGRRFSFPMQVLHHTADTPLAHRFTEALANAATPYVALMADDDFHLEQGMNAALAHLDAHADCGVAYGHVIDFELEEYVPYGDLKRFANGKLNPPAQWLEDDSPVQRLSELGRSPWWTTGWYAVQRRELLAEVVRVATANGFNNEMLERSMNLLQPIHGKVCKLDAISLARQGNPRERRKPWSFKANRAAIAQLEEAACQALTTRTGLPAREAKDFIRRALLPEVAQLIRNDRLDRLWATASGWGLTSVYHGLRHAKRQVNGWMRSGNETEDSRLPSPPLLSEDLAEVRIIVQACRRREVSLPEAMEEIS